MCCPICIVAINNLASARINRARLLLYHRNTVFYGADFDAVCVLAGNAVVVDDVGHVAQVPFS